MITRFLFRKLRRPGASMRSALSSLAVVTCLVAAIAVPAHAKFTNADPKGPVKVGCPSGSFLDPRNGGECWKCPSGYDRTVLNPVSSPNACQKPATYKHKEAEFEHAWACDGDKGEFFDGRKGGECWKCPSDRPRRTAYAVTSDKACATKEIIGEKFGEAKFRHKFKGCRGRSFFDLRNGGECWSCPKGYDRTASAVTSDKACSKRSAEDFEKATKVSSTCPPGAFADPNGTCYSCPESAPLRSVYPVTGQKACASSLQEALVPDLPKAQDMCRNAVAALDRALKEGEKARDQLIAVVNPLVEPIRKPLEEKIDEVIDRVFSKTGLGEALDDVAEPFEPYVQDGADYAKNLADNRNEIRAILLDPNIMCGGDGKKILDAVKKYLRVKGNNFITISLSASFRHPSYAPRMNLGLTFASNLDKKGGLYFGVGLSASAPTDPSPVTVTLSGAFYPKRTLADFALSPIPETSFSFGKGGAWDEAVKKFPPLSTVAAVDSIDIAWDWDTKHLPALGISKELFSARPGQKGIFSATGAIGWGIPIVVYDM